MKRITACVLALCLICALALSGCGNIEADDPKENLREFTDSLGRTVLLPEKLKGLAMSGPMTQIYVFPLCPELLVGFSTAFSEDAEKYIPEEYLGLPELGQLYGGKGTINTEALLAAAPDVVVDVGEPKDGMAEELDELTEQTGIPFVHVNATVATSPEAYRMLGELIGSSEKAEKLASWCEMTLSRVDACMEKVDADGARKDLVYCLGPKGLNVLADGSYHAQILGLCAKNAARLESPVPHGDGNEIDMEQLILWDPEVILFQHNSVYGSVGNDSTWRELRAVKNGQYYEIPCGPYGWISSPPAVQCCLGMLWLTDLLYPEYTDCDLRAEVTEYYKLFYGYELSDADYARLVG